MELVAWLRQKEYVAPLMFPMDTERAALASMSAGIGWGPRAPVSMRPVLGEKRPRLELAPVVIFPLTTLLLSSCLTEDSACIVLDSKRDSRRDCPEFCRSSFREIEIDTESCDQS